ncbi:MAG: crossover junction endodeoxyribonuclease RuvC [Deltaproteobacteria bacterium]|nr:crossover junction endodeoxyribonuclease RuvC [Deltaproteobacteria bacterium]
MRRIYQGLQEVLQRYKPKTLSLEKVFFARNAQSALKLGQARGVALLAGAENQLDLQEYTPVVIKQSVVGYGHASKLQMQKMVSSLLHLREPLTADAADALAAAICHLHQQTFQSRVATAVTSGRQSRGRWTVRQG